MQKPRVLVIEDDKDVVRVIEHQLCDLGLEVEWTGDGEEGLSKALAGKYALIILDLQLPGLEGGEVCCRLREENDRVPLLMLTGRSELVDVVFGLQVGADEYITKPFELMEFSARVRALLRRSELRAQAQSALDPQYAAIVRYCDLVMNDASRLVTLCGNRLELTLTEYDLLRFFIVNPGQVLTRENILEALWETDVPQYEDNVTTYMSRLRSKLSIVPEYGNCIITLRGVGYRLITEEEFRAGR